MPESFILNDDGTRASAEQTQVQSDGSTVTTDSSWTYDAMQRLTGESVTSSVSDESYRDVFAYDLNSNRMSDVHTGPGDGTSDTTTYVYNGNDELTSQTSEVSGTTTNSYDANGSLVSSTTGSDVTTYGYDVRNKMVSYSNGTTTATYVCDDAGNRVQETVNGTTTVYLTDTQNPTGYAEPIEAKTSPTGAPTMTYVLGNRVLAQADSSGNVNYLLTDGHGSTQQITDATGVVTNTFRYDAFGGAINFTPSTAPTVFLFGGDAIYDPASGLYMHGDGMRDRLGFEFIQADSQGNGSNSDPISLHKYLYAGADSVNAWDPSGHDLTGLLVTMGISGTLSASVTGAYGYAEGWSAGQIAKASGYAFLTGAAAGGLAYGAAAGFAAALVAGGATAAEARAAGWAAVGLIGGSTGVGLAIGNVQNAYQHGDSTDRAFAVVNLGLASVGFISSHWSAFNLAAGATAAKLPQVTLNKIAGDAAENDFIANAQANGLNVVGRRVSVNTPFGTRVIDVVLQDENGINYGVEVKSSVGAMNRNDAGTRQQFAADRWINTNDGVFGLGEYSHLRISGTSKILWRPQ